MTCLALENLHYQYQDQLVLDQLNLQLDKNEIICLLGASGCGKTTTLKAIAGLIRPQAGRVLINEQCVSDERSFLPPQQRHIGMMFQDYALFPHLTISENVAFGLSKLSEKLRRQRVAEMLELVRLSDFAKRYPHQLSGGQQQRVAIARSLAYQPALLLLDEPFSNIDAQSRFRLIDDIRAIIKQQQVSAIFVSHAKEEAFAFADKLAIMHRGDIAQLGSAAALFQSPKHRVVAEFLGKGIYLPAHYESETSVSTPFGLVMSTRLLKRDHTHGEIYVRPEHIELIYGKSPLHVKVEQSRFVGTAYVYRIQVAGQELDVKMPALQNMDLSRSLTLALSPHAVNFFESNV